MKFNILSTSFEIEIDKADFAAILQYESELGFEDRYSLGYQLENIEGVNEVDYDDYFGNRILFFIEEESNITKTKEEILKIIIGFIAESHEEPNNIKQNRSRI